MTGLKLRVRCRSEAPRWLIFYHVIPALWIWSDCSLKTSYALTAHHREFCDLFPQHTYTITVMLQLAHTHCYALTSSCTPWKKRTFTLHMSCFHSEISRLNFVWPCDYIIAALLFAFLCVFVCMWGALMPYVSDVCVCVFLRCVYTYVCVCSPWQPMVLRVTSLSDLFWPLEASAPPHLFCSSPLWPKVWGLYLSGAQWCRSCRVGGYTFALGFKG